MMAEAARRRLSEVLAKPIKSPLDAERAARAAEILAAYLRADEEVGDLLDRTKDEVKTRPQGSLAGITLHAAAEAVLSEAGVPLHARELGKRIRARGWNHPRSANPRRDQIVFQLAARLPRHATVFRRVAPNTFALVRWDEERTRMDVPKPRTGVFRGSGESVARAIGDRGDEAAGDSQWR